MTFSAPEWFFLLPVFLLLGRVWRRLELWRPLRLLLILVVTVLLVDPRIEKQQDALDLWVLLDRSGSTEDLIDKGLPEWGKLLEQPPIFPMTAPPNTSLKKQISSSVK